jgi:hypothetical protein
MYLLVWEKLFMYSFVSVKHDVPTCLRAKFRYAFSLSTSFVRHDDIDAYSGVINATNKQTNKHAKYSNCHVENRLHYDLQGRYNM